MAPVATGTVREALASAVDALAAAGVDSPRLDAELLLAEALGWERTRLATDPDAGVEPHRARVFGAMVRRRVSREPVAYILGRRGFRRLELVTDGRALIPRPETELLVEVALELRPASVLDVGTGCGAIALAVADELPEAKVTAVDVSRPALALAAENAARLGLAGSIRLELGALPAAREFDLVLANLPYVPDPEWPRLQPEITRYEPRGAVLGGSDGLEPIRGLLAALAPGDAGLRIECGAVALEVGEGQASTVAELIAGAGFGSTEVRPDLAGIDRCVLGRR